MQGFILNTNLRPMERDRRRGMQLMELPVDTLVDILLRLPVKKVACVKCVSKTLSNIVSNISFSTLHSRLWAAAAAADQVPRLMYCSRNRNLLTLQSLKYKENSLTEGRFSTTISSSTPAASVRFVFHNIICLVFWLTEDCILVNSLGESGVLRLPECSFGTGIYSKSLFGMGFDDKTNTYKIVCVTYDRDDDRMHTSMTARVLALGTNSWRQITSLPPCELDWGKDDVVCVNGAAHWLTRPELDDRIVSFDFRKEEFCWTPTPPTFQSLNKHGWDSDSNLGLFTLKGCLAIVGTKSSWSYSSGKMRNIEIWVLKDFDQQEKVWEIYYNTKIPECFPFEFYNPPGEWEHGIFCTSTNVHGESSVFFIDVRDGSLNRVVYSLRDVKVPAVIENADFHLGTFSYSEALISLKDYGDLDYAHQVMN